MFPSRLKFEIIEFPTNKVVLQNLEHECDIARPGQVTIISRQIRKRKQSHQKVNEKYFCSIFGVNYELYNGKLSVCSTIIRKLVFLEGNFCLQIS